MLRSVCRARSLPPFVWNYFQLVYVTPTRDLLQEISHLLQRRYVCLLLWGKFSIWFRHTRYKCSQEEIKMLNVRKVKMYKISHRLFITVTSFQLRPIKKNVTPVLVLLLCIYKRLFTGQSLRNGPLWCTQDKTNWRERIVRLSGCFVTADKGVWRPVMVPKSTFTLICCISVDTSDMEGCLYVLKL